MQRNAKLGASAHLPSCHQRAEKADAACEHEGLQACVCVRVTKPTASSGHLSPALPPCHLSTTRTTGQEERAPLASTGRCVCHPSPMRELHKSKGSC